MATLWRRQADHWLNYFDWAIHSAFRAALSRKCCSFWTIKIVSTTGRKPVCDGLRAALSVSVNQLTARHTHVIGRAVCDCQKRQCGSCDQWGPRLWQALVKQIHNTCQTHQHIRNAVGGHMVQRCKWEAANRKKKKKPKLNYPMFTISLQISTLALHSNTHRQTHRHLCTITITFRQRQHHSSHL